MKKYLFLSFAAAMLLTSCVSIKQIAHLNVASTRNVVFNGGTQYALLATYAGDTKSEIKKSKATSIQDAINATLRRYPGGEFMTNVKIWAVAKGGDYYFAVSGDVYGIAKDNGKVERSYRGFEIGDNVIWEEPKGQFNRGTIETFIDDENCMVRRENGKPVKVKFVKLSK